MTTLVTGLGAFAVTLVLVPAARWLSVRVGALDPPEGCRYPACAVPCLGGLAVLAGACAAAAGFFLLGSPLAEGGAGGPAGSPGSWVLVGVAALVLAAVGIQDDVRQITVRRKLVIEAAAAAVVAFWALDVRTIDFGWFEMGGGTGLLAGGLVAFWIVSVTNAFNMVDGHDGLASGVGAVAAATFGAVAFLSGDPVSGTVAFALGGAFAAFLFFNFPPASIYLGDSGSLPLGFLLAVTAVLALTHEGSWAVLPAVLVLGVPVLDVSMAVARRLCRPLVVVRDMGVRARFKIHLRHWPRLFERDRGHPHHRLALRGLGPGQVLAVAYGAALAAAAAAVAATLRPTLAPVIFVVLSTVVVSIAVNRLYPELQVLRRGLLLPLFDSRLAGIAPGQFSFRVLDACYRRASNGRRRTLIYGAGRTGRLVLDELLSNRGLGMNPAAFLDDDPALWGRRVEGYPVLNPNGDLRRMLEEGGVRNVVLSTDKLVPDRLKEVENQCERAGVPILRLRWETHPQERNRPAPPAVELDEPVTS